MSKFTLTVQAGIKNFKKQQKPTLIDKKWTLNIDSVEDFLSEMFLCCKPYLKREIIVDPLSRSQTFSEKEMPLPEDIAKFVEIRDPVGRHSFPLDSVSEQHLTVWSDERELTIFIYPHSTSIIYRDQWQNATKGSNALIPEAKKDKAGAPAETEIENLVKKLKEIHRMNYDGMHIHWRCWAEYLINKGSVDETSLERPPPISILRFFETARSNASNQLLTIRQNVNVAEGINLGYESDISDLVRDFKNLVSLSEARYEAEKCFQQKLMCLLDKVHTNASCLELYSTAMRPSESEISKEYLMEIGSQEDVDHMTEEFLDENREENVDIEEEDYLM